MFGYRVPAPDEAMLISGGRRGLGGAPFRVVTGHGKFVLPIFRKTRFLSLAMSEAEVVEKCVTRQGIALTVRAVIAFKVGNDTESIVNAGQRFLSDQDQMSVLTGRIFAGHLRSIIGSMTVEEIVTERQKLAAEVLDTSKAEMAKIGLIVDSLQIQSIDDGNTGYIDAMSAPHKAAIQRQAQIAQAQATQASTQAQQEAQRNQAEYARQTAVVQAEYKAEVDRAQAAAAQAGPLAQAHAEQEVLAARTELAERAAELRQQQLVAEVVKPAEADAERIRVMAIAEAERMKIQAAAAASYDRVALDRMLIDQLPQIVKEAAGGLKGANVNVLNGADGLGEIAAGLVGQGLTILDSVRRNLGGPDGDAKKSGGEMEIQRYLGAASSPVDGRDGGDDGPVDIR
ncbi:MULTISPECIES: flotillin family protein [unclassified Streptomyces]|uniref:SPFH domain-containing protein n=1 Tax=unclassified Streptomyces TaxID=2593676 RepID=UPI002251158E|nr:flotillin family protein [Streptomyces sp. NBC_00063]MCX5437045.1 SPFH domain-containing protein [Streptomyces sp. NBC_00063]WSE14771.1 SPFH domain-containing protein [Streptomyces sp. NBC_01397]